jgi:hypothetical protein
MQKKENPIADPNLKSAIMTLHEMTYHLHFDFFGCFPKFVVGLGTQLQSKSF